METTSKNIAIGSFLENEIEDGFKILRFENEADSSKRLTKEVGQNLIQFHFCIKGAIRLNFNKGNYGLNLTEEKAILLYNPKRELPLDMDISPKSWVVSLLIPIKNFHALFSEEAGYIDFLKEDNRGKKYYKESTYSPSMAVVLNQILNFNLHPSVQRIYLKGKVFELIGLYFNRPEEVDVEQCPFLVDENNVQKIRKAKDILVQRMTEPPSLQELSDEIGLSLKKLKVGFKEIYGETVFGFLLDYKMEYARKLLEHGSYNVNEVGLRIGYSTGSHFIAAFKKKFGTTPKKYIQNIPTKPGA